MQVKPVNNVRPYSKWMQLAWTSAEHYKVITSFQQTSTSSAHSTGEPDRPSNPRAGQSHGSSQETPGCRASEVKQIVIMLRAQSFSHTAPGISFNLNRENPTRTSGHNHMPQETLVATSHLLRYQVWGLRNLAREFSG